MENPWAFISYILIITILIYISLKIWKERIFIKNQLNLEHLAREKEHELNEQIFSFLPIYLMNSEHH